MKALAPMQTHSVTARIDTTPIAFRSIPTGHTISFSLNLPEIWQKVRTWRGLLALNLETYEKQKVSPDTKVYAVHFK